MPKEPTETDRRSTARPSASDRLETVLIHGGELRPRIRGAAVAPIFQCTVFEQEGGANGSGYHDLAYPRLSTLPNHQGLHDKLAALEQAEAALVTASGMAAISTTLLTLLRPGDHLLAQAGLYGGTHQFFRTELAELGVAVSEIDVSKPDSWPAQQRPETRVVFVEGIGNPMMRVADHRAVVAFARERGLTSVIDNTFATPINFRPLPLGYDVCLHSATKYLNGHSDLAAGVVAGGATVVGRIKRRLDHLGGTLDPHACFLLHRGLRTLSLRVRQQNATALLLARALAERPELVSVQYPGLAEHPQHAIARELFGGFGGMLSVEVKGGADAAKRFIANLRIPLDAPSLGGLETLVTRPVATSHRGMSAADREKLGITDALVRISVGIEHPEDLIQDFLHALDQMVDRAG